MKWKLNHTTISLNKVRGLGNGNGLGHFNLGLGFVPWVSFLNIEHDQGSGHTILLWTLISRCTTNVSDEICLNSLTNSKMFVEPNEVKDFAPCNKSGNKFDGTNNILVFISKRKNNLEPRERSV